MFAFPLGLLALLGVPAVLGLHLFRRRFRPHTVSALFLWTDPDTAPVAGRRRERLRSSASLWLELLAALLLGLAFAGPRGCTPAEVPHLVVVLDATASMAAVPSRGATVDAVRALVEERLDALGEGARVTLVETGPRPRLLAGPAAPAQPALEALAGYAPGALRHDPGPALVLARELAGEADVLYVTDHVDEDADPAEGLEVVSVGHRADNVGLVHATRTRERDADGAVVERALVTVQAFTDAPVRRTLVVEGPTRELARRELALAPEEREHVTFPLPEGFPTVRVRLDEPDALAVDDEVVLAPEPRRTLLVGTTLGAATLRRLGLADGTRPLGRLVDALPDARAVEAEEAHLVLGAAPAGAAHAWALELPLAGLEPGEGDSRLDLVGPFLSDRRHPLLSGVTLEGLVWSVDPGLALPGVPLVSAGDLPVLTEVATGTARVLHANLDPARSTLARSPDWAVLLSNLAEARRAELPGPGAVNVAVGGAFVLRGVEPGEYTARHDGDGTVLETRAAGAEVRFEGVPRPGEYVVRRRGDDAPLARFAARFEDAAESDLRDRRPGERGAAASPGAVAAEANPLVALAGALALFCLLADWWVLGRRARRAAPGSAR